MLNRFFNKRASKNSDSGTPTDTRLTSAEQIAAILVRERSRSSRNGYPLSVAVFTSETGRAALEKTGGLMAGRARETDVVGWLDETRLCAILVDTATEGARKFSAQVVEMARRHQMKVAYQIYCYPSDEMGGTGGKKEMQVRRSGDKNGHNGHPRHESRVHPRAHDSIKAPEPQPLEALLAVKMPWWKRAIDITGAGFGLLALSPVLLCIAAAIKLTSKGPVIFKQHRTGLGGKAFWMFKFRSMVVDAEDKKQSLMALNQQDGPAFKILKDPRVTMIGRIIRKTSLDELPQLWNVVRGDMSLVGPRPLPVREAEKTFPWHRRRLDVTPGLTCIWQITRTVKVTFDEWVRMDVRYIRQQTFRQDVKILLRTIPVVLMQKGER